MGDECSICRRPREAKADYCPLHLAAMDHLTLRYDRWRFAIGESLSKTDYYNQVRELPETGNAVKNLIAQLLKKQGTG